jgi:hypothetical protein
VGSVPLKVEFPRLFSLSTQKGTCVRELWSETDSGDEWRFLWRCDLFVWELALLQDLLGRIVVFEEVGECDYWVRKLDNGGCFSVKSCYSLLERFEAGDSVIGGVENRVLNYIWKSPAPLKVLAFSWTLLLDRIPTRSNLALRRVLVGWEDACVCVFCGRMEETTRHLFLHGEVVSKV